MKKSVAVLGLGKIGSSIARSLAKGGAEVLAVDKDEDLVRDIADKVTCAVCADISDKEMIWLFKHAKAVILPYIEATQSGIIPIAYKYRLPVVISNVPGLMQFVDNGKTGFVCSTGHDYIHAFKKMDDEKNYLRMQSYCLNYSEMYLSWNANVMDLIKSIGI